MAREKQNPNNSSILQALLDLEKVLKSSSSPNSPVALQALNDLKKNVNKNDLKQADEIFVGRNYPSDSIDFVKFWNESDIWEHLSNAASRILLRMARKARLSGVYIVNQTLLCQILHMNRGTVSKAVQELEDMGCITKICTLKSRGNGPSGTAYMIYGEIASSGKFKNSHLYEQIVSEDTLDVFESNNMSIYETIVVKLDYDGHILNCVYEDIVEDET